jgi:type I restriction enzyme, S subunit
VAGLTAPNGTRTTDATGEVAWGFTSVIENTVQSLRALMLNNRNLCKTRDLLLPKLISGELNVEGLNIETGQPLMEAAT